VDPLAGSNHIQFNHQQRLSYTGTGEQVPQQLDGLARGFEGDSTLKKADELKRMAVAHGRNEVTHIEGFPAGSVEEFSDLALNGLESKEFHYLGV
jgi:hypothetical protein